MNNNRIVNVGFMPKQVLPPLPVGANNMFQAGRIQANQDAISLNELTKGGSKRRKKRKNFRYKGGASQAVVLVPPAPPYSTFGTQDNYYKLTNLAMDVNNAKIFDNATTQSQVARLATNQQNLYYGKGGSSTHWGCLSGGKKSRCNKSKRCNKSRCKRKHRKTCKHRKRHRY